MFTGVTIKGIGSIGPAIVGRHIQYCSLLSIYQKVYRRINNTVLNKI